MLDFAARYIYILYPRWNSFPKYRPFSTHALIFNSRVAHDTFKKPHKHDRHKMSLFSQKHTHAISPFIPSRLTHVLKFLDATRERKREIDRSRFTLNNFPFPAEESDDRLIGSWLLFSTSTFLLLLIGNSPQSRTSIERRGKEEKSRN